MEKHTTNSVKDTSIVTINDIKNVINHNVDVKELPLKIEKNNIDYLTSSNIIEIATTLIVNSSKPNLTLADCIFDVMVIQAVTNIDLNDLFAVGHEVFIEELFKVGDMLMLTGIQEFVAQNVFNLNEVRNRMYKEIELHYIVNNSFVNHLNSLPTNDELSKFSNELSNTVNTLNILNKHIDPNITVADVVNAKLGTENDYQK